MFPLGPPLPVPLPPIITVTHGPPPLLGNRLRATTSGTTHRGALQTVPYPSMTTRPVSWIEL